MVPGISSCGSSPLLCRESLSDATGAAAEAGAGVAGGKKRRRPRQLARPVICICNDLYAPVMRPLRARAAVFQFKQPSVCC